MRQAMHATSHRPTHDAEGSPRRPGRAPSIERGPQDAALALLGRAPWVHMAGVGEDGAPLLRTLHTVIVDGHVAFHGGVRGEKLACLGREGVLAVEEPLSTLPSYVIDPERACPATTWFDSVQVRGVLEVVEDRVRKAAVLQALMERHQPEGGHVRIEADHPLYTSVLDRILVAQVPLTDVCRKLKLGQNRTAAQLGRVVEFLWRRGAPVDLRTLERVREVYPEVALPGSMVAPEGLRFVVELSPERQEEAVELLVETYWSRDFSREAIAEALRCSHVVGAVDLATGKLVATARAISDLTRHAWIYDVVVAEAWRGRGIGESLMRLLLDHPAVRGARVVRLGTRDAATFYERLGFVAVERVVRPWRTVEMVRLAASAVATGSSSP